MTEKRRRRRTTGSHTQPRLEASPTEVTPGSRSSESVLNCMLCDRPNPPDARFCAGCGHQFGADVFEDEDGVADPLLGRVIADRYRMEELLGRGGMGVVYRVEHVNIGKLMAMKLLHGALARDKDTVKRFKRGNVWWFEVPWIWRFPLDYYMGILLSIGLVGLASWSAGGTAILGTDADPSITRFLHDLFAATPATGRGAWARVLVEEIGHREHIDLSGLTVPTLVIGSTNDRLLPMSQARAIAESAPNLVELVEMPGGHCAILEHPGDVNGHLRDLVRSTVMAEKISS